MRLIAWASVKKAIMRFLGPQLGTNDSAAKTQLVQGDEARFDAFISYSHAADGRLAPALRNGLHRFAKPLFKLRALTVFRDETSLSATPALWPSIEEALGRSRFFILMASPEAAASPWVAREVDWWCRHQTATTILIVLTDGEMAWDNTGCDFDWSRTTALPTQLRGVFVDEPRWINLRWARNATDISLSNPRFREAIADLAAPLHGRAKDEMIGEDVAAQRRVARLRLGAISVLTLLVIVAAGAAVYAGIKRQQAQQELRQSYLSQAIANRWSTRPGRRLDSLKSLGKAAEIQPGMDLRNEAIASMALVDLQKGQDWNGSLFKKAFGLDSQLEHYARSDDDGNISVHRTDNDEEIASLPGPGQGANAWVIQFSPDGRWLAAKYNPDIFRVWDLRAGTTVLEDKPIRVSQAALVFSPDSQSIAFGLEDGSIHLYDLASQARRRLATGPQPHSMAFHPECPQLAVSSWPGRAVLVYDLHTGMVIRSLPHQAEVTGVAWSADGRLLASASADFGIYVWDLNHSECDLVNPNPPKSVAVLHGHQAEPIALAFSRDGNLLASTSWDGTVRLWDPLSGRPLVITRGDLERPIQFSADGQRLAFTMGASKLGLWDVISPHGYRTLHSYRERGMKGPWSADFSPDGRLLVSAHSDGVRLWDVFAGREVAFIDQRQPGQPLGYISSVIRVVPQ
jgi:WD40 repeat protein